MAKVSSWAKSPGPDWSVRSHSDTDIVWQHPSGDVTYQFREPPTGLGKVVQVKTVRMTGIALASGAAGAALVEVARHFLA